MKVRGSPRLLSTYTTVTVIHTPKHNTDKHSAGQAGAPSPIAVRHAPLRPPKPSAIGYRRNHRSRPMANDAAVVEDSTGMVREFLGNFRSASFDSFHAVGERLSQRPLADGAEYSREHASLEVLAFAHDDDVDVGHSVGLSAQGVGVARCAAEHVRVGSRELDVVGIRPVVLQTFPNTA